jgi:hypothetical protein
MAVEIFEVANVAQADALKRELPAREAAGRPESEQSDSAQAGASSMARPAPTPSQPAPTPSQPAPTPSQPAASKGDGTRPFRLFVISLILIGFVIMLVQSQQANHASRTVLAPEIGTDAAPADAIPAGPTATVPAPASGGHIF